ncbi:MAG: SPOR domain-containing protein [Pseudomonadota bacterium]
MDTSLKQRLVGAVVLIALAVIFLPMLVKGPAPDSGVSDVSLDIPVEPRSDDVQTRDLPLEAPGSVPPGGATGMPGTVVESVPAGSAQGGLFPAIAAGDYAVSFGTYATTADADRVIAALRTAELPAYREATNVAGRAAHRVRIGPFADRAIAEAARLRAANVRDDVDARVVVLDADASAPAVAAAPATTPAKPAVATTASVPANAPAVAPKPAESAPKPVAAAPAPAATAKPPAVPAPTPAASASGTGFAVQVGAFAAANDATALRDKLRGAGFNAFTESVRTDKGTLTRVRVGPAMTRAEADQLKASVQAKLGIAGMVRPHP